MKLYLLYDKLLKKTDKAYILSLSLNYTNETTKDISFRTKCGEELCLSELPPNLKFTIVMPISQSQVISNHIIEISDWFYTKAIHNFEIKLDKNDSVYFKQIYTLWLRKTIPANLVKVDIDSDFHYFDYSTNELNDYSNLY